MTPHPTLPSRGATRSSPAADASPGSASHGTRNLALVVVVVIVVAVAGSVFVLGAFNHPSRSWLFRGAYATYSGTATLIVPVNFTLRIDVVDFNSTAVETVTTLAIDSQLFSSSNQSSSWQKLDAFSGGIPGSAFKSYDTTRLVGSKTYDCVAYEYSNRNGTFTVYVSKASGFPIDITLSSSASYLGNLTLDMELVRTNIPGLP